MQSLIKKFEIMLILILFSDKGKNIFKKSIKALHRLDKEEETSIKLIKL